jgi:YegS/Rv2252/BmrU family lipid kinase
MVMVHPLVIINPSSRGGRGATDWPLAAVSLRTHFGTFEPRFTESPGDAVRIARDEAVRGRRLILTFGGDGTISEAARGIVDSGKPCELGVLPHGTGADFLRTLAMPRRLADAARAIRNARATLVDVGEVSFSNGASRTFINSASFGLSAEVADAVNRDGAAKSRGSFAYVSATLEGAKRFQPKRVELRIDDGAWAHRWITSVSLHNGKYFGGGMKMAPSASITDGTLDLVVVERMRLERLLLRAPVIYFGLHVALPEVQVRPTRVLEARSYQGKRRSESESGSEPKSKHERRMLVEVDGDIAGQLPARFTLRERALRVRVPEGRLS